MLKRHLAEEILAQLFECSGKLDKSVSILQGAVDDELLIRYRRLVGQTLAEFYDGIMSDLFKQYPDLEPDSIKVGDNKDA